MKSLSIFAASILLNSAVIFADGSVNYTDAGNNERTMSVETTQFATSRPEVCKEKAAPVEAPKAAPAPAPVPVVPEADSDGDGVVDSKDKCPNTPHGYVVDPGGCPTHVTLHINFAFDSSVLPKSADGDIAKLTRVLGENPPAVIKIVGHTDSTGSDEYNQKLSERRAASLAKRLGEKGIDKTRIQSSGKGEKEPIATNATKQGRAENRRIEVELQ